MIDISNIKNVLPVLGFSKDKAGNWKKSYPNVGCSIKVNFKSQSFEYPTTEGMTVTDKTTSNFLKPENFIVFECINRLFDKGYRPKDIVLEKEWQLGHGGKSGKADICVKNKNGKGLLLLIECKKDRSEYLKEKKNLNADGGQLFSYWQQERSTSWLSLYYSDFVNGSVIPTYEVIKCYDDKNIELLAKKDESILLYKNAKSVEDLFRAWDETYSKQTLKGLLFGQDDVAYQIGEKPLRKKDLKKFDEDDIDIKSIVDHFAEILRHNNISDKENAFNRLVALFICKLVDEIGKSEEDIVEFQYKVGTDTYESLQDRLQRLHRDGMERFMKEKISYIPDDYPEKLFAQKVDGPEREEAIKDLRNTIRILKFYSNNDFSFKDVHNEELFYQNGKTLVEVVQLFERYRIVYPSRTQFLGDLFERLLNDGFKQDEGQFFTPTPITRFIWDSLPIDKVAKVGSSYEVPKIIDYACGAGHFLTEGVEAINVFFARTNHQDKVKDNLWAGKKLFGIEKDYRLARVSKISLYMNGAGEGNIVFGDGLEQYVEKGIENATFDILAANPPYSVLGFKPHLKLKYNSLELLSVISNDGKEIEALFVERISQLLKAKGVAAVILPESLFSNETEIETRARTLMIENFYLRAVVRLGAQTFSRTGTNTDIVFLEKYDDPPKRNKLIVDSVTCILSGKNLDGWEDKDILEDYVSTIDVTIDDYKKFIAESLSEAELEAIDYFKPIVQSIVASRDYKKKVESKAFKKLAAQTQSANKKRFIYYYMKESEARKLYTYALVYKQNTLIVSAPEKTKEEQQFLGYRWRNSVIKIFNPGGSLYDSLDRTAPDTLAELIRLSFYGKTKEIEHLKKYYRYSALQDMIDFSRPYFSQVITLEQSNDRKMISNYEIKPIGEYCTPEIGGTPDRDVPAYFGGNHLWVSIAEMKGQVINDTKEKITDEGILASNVKLIPKDTVLLSFKLSIGKVAISGQDLYTNEAIAALIPKDKKKVLTEYLFYLFKGKMIDLTKVGKKKFGRSLNKKFLTERVEIPMPPTSVQKKIIAACKKVDTEFAQTRMTDDEYQKRIAKFFGDTGVLRYE